MILERCLRERSLTSSRSSLKSRRREWAATEEGIVSGRRKYAPSSVPNMASKGWMPTSLLRASLKWNWKAKSTERRDR
jgi:hypothetical protein